MGGLYGSEYWTYLMPRRIGHGHTAELTSAPFEAIGTRRAVEIGLLDDAFGDNVERFAAHVRALARDLAAGPYLVPLLESKLRARRRDERIKPLAAYRTEELARSYECFFGEDRSYHEARQRFVHKLGAPCVVTAPARPQLRAAQGG
jgi:putative two-component system hydrogenase maturation factor HypX/HoxX